MATNRIAKAISAWLCPEVHRDAERYGRLWRGLDDARWWLGAQHPEAASLAHRLLDEDQFYWTSQKPMRRPEWKWQAPEWVNGISEFRRWLDTGPFDFPPIQAGTSLGDRGEG